jgi:hypothetical protein
MRAVTHRHRFKFAPPVGYAGQGPAHPPFYDSFEVKSFLQIIRPLSLHYLRCVRVRRPRRSSVQRSCTISALQLSVIHFT